MRRFKSFACNEVQPLHKGVTGIGAANWGDSFHGLEGQAIFVEFSVVCFAKEQRARFLIGISFL